MLIDASTSQIFHIFCTQHFFSDFFNFRLSLFFKRQKSEKTFVEPCVQDKSQTIGVRAVKTEN